LSNEWTKAQSHKTEAFLPLASKKALIGCQEIGDTIGKSTVAENKTRHKIYIPPERL
jgi:hypothetical protein